MPHGLRVAIGAIGAGANADHGDELEPEFPISSDLIVSADVASLPTSLSRPRVNGPPVVFMQDDNTRVASETLPLLGNGGKERRKKPFYRARPLWIVPFAVLAAITRGMTIAPRVEVFTQLSCNAIYGHPIDYNHTTQELLSHRHAQFQVEREVLHSVTNLVDDSDDTEDPTHIPSKRCLSDPAVQAGAARLQTIMTTTMGVLSALTTGWWGHFGERHGRIRVLAASSVGLLLTDLMFILVSMPHSPLSGHGHKLLIISPVIEGLLGGWSTLQGATSAYISDCTSDGSRAHIFARFTGVFFLGFSVGPMLGAFILTHPPPLPFVPNFAGRSVTPVFWVAVLCSLMNVLLAVFVFPESLSKEQRRSTCEAEETAKAVAAADREGRGLKKENRGVLSTLKGLFVPLLVFAPKKRANGRDWNMTLLALALFGYLLSSGIFQLKYLYAEHVFSWGAEQLSYYITFVGGMRAVHLLFAMPLIISVFKPKPPVGSVGVHGKKPKPTRAHLAAEMAFDLRLSRLSFAIDILSHTLVSLSSTASTSAAQASFVGFTVLSCFGSGVVPGVQSLALCVLQADAAEEAETGSLEGVSASDLDDTVVAPAVKSPGVGTGSLFGAFAVLQATGQMILGPLLFGLVYSTTVARFPKGIFVLAASILVVSIALLAFVRPRPVITTADPGKPKKTSRAWTRSEVERGRSRVSKDLSHTLVGEGPYVNAHPSTLSSDGCIDGERQEPQLAGRS